MTFPIPHFHPEETDKPGRPKKVASPVVTAKYKLGKPKKTA
jgi:hypothetical protein